MYVKRIQITIHCLLKIVLFCLLHYYCVALSTTVKQTGKLSLVSLLRASAVHFIQGTLKASFVTCRAEGKRRRHREGWMPLISMEGGGGK